MSVLPCVAVEGAKKSNYKVRFRHGVFPKTETQATWADIKKYDYFYGTEQIWVGTPGQGMHAESVSWGLGMGLLMLRL